MSTAAPEIVAVLVSSVVRHADERTAEETEPAIHALLARVFLAQYPDYVVGTDARRAACAVAYPCPPDRLHFAFDRKTKMYVELTVPELLPMLVSDGLARLAATAHPALSAVLARWCKTGKSQRKVAALVADQIYDPGFESQLDTVPHEFHFANGWVDLRTGAFRARDTMCRVTKCNPYNYRPADEVRAGMAELECALKDLADNDDARHECIKAWHGYCLTGETSGPTCLLATGTGAAAERSKRVLQRMFVDAFPAYARYLLDSDECNPADMHRPSLYFVLARCRLQRFVATNTWRPVLQLAQPGHAHAAGLQSKLSVNTREPFAAVSSPQSLELAFSVKAKGKSKRSEDKRAAAAAAESAAEAAADAMRDRMLTDAGRLALFHVLLPYAMRFYAEGSKEVFAPARADAAAPPPAKKTRRAPV